MTQARWLVAVVCLPSAMATSTDALQAQVSAPITTPTVSEEVALLEPIAPTARDGTRGEGFLRAPSPVAAQHA